MSKTIRVILSPEAEEVYNYLNEKAPASKLERSLLNSVNKKFQRKRFLRNSSKNTESITYSEWNYHNSEECCTPSIPAKQRLKSLHSY